MMIARILFLVRWLWFRFKCFVHRHGRRYERRTDRAHKLLIIGDHMASGFGDRLPLWCTDFGLSARLPVECRRTSSSPRLLHAWTFINVAEPNATSDDWVAPPKKRSKSESDSLVGGQLWRRYFEERDDLRDCDIAIVQVGAMDNVRGKCPSGFEHSVDNLKALCTALADRFGMHVFVAMLPVKGFNLGFQRRNRRRNALIRAWLDASNSNFVGAGVDYEHRRWLDADCYMPDGTNWTGDGHAMSAREWRSIVQTKMKAVEWRQWKRRLVNESGDQKAKDD
jgi:hypothetical protein